MPEISTLLDFVESDSTSATRYCSLPLPKARWISETLELKRSKTTSRFVMSCNPKRLGEAVD